MKGRIGSVILLVAVAALITRPWEGEPGPRPSSTLRGTVLRAVDGDTLEVRLDGGTVETVRLIGVDTPETVKPETPVQCFGPRASAFAHRVAEGQRVRLSVGAEPRDIYGRLLAYAYVHPRPGTGPASGPNKRRVSDNPGGPTQRERFLNAELLRLGLARTLSIPPNTRFAERFSALQSAAARKARGLWGVC